MRVAAITIAGASIVLSFSGWRPGRQDGRASSRKGPYVHLGVIIYLAWEAGAAAVGLGQIVMMTK